MDRVRGADDLGVTMVSIKIFASAPSQRTGCIRECVASYGDPEVPGSASNVDQSPDQSSLASGNCARSCRCSLSIFALFQTVPSATIPSRLELIWGTQRSASQPVTNGRSSLAIRCSWAKLADSGSSGVSVRRCWNAGWGSARWAGGSAAEGQVDSGFGFGLGVSGFAALGDLHSVELLPAGNLVDSEQKQTRALLSVAAFDGTLARSAFPSHRPP